MPRPAAVGMRGGDGGRALGGEESPCEGEGEGAQEEAALPQSGELEPEV